MAGPAGTAASISPSTRAAADRRCGARPAALADVTAPPRRRPGRSLTVVPDPVEEDEEPWDAPQPWQAARDDPAPPVEPEPEPDVFAGDDERISAIVARDLDQIFSAHPAAATLTALARRLAQVLDEPVDGRVAAAVTKELRATVADLVAAEEDEDDDLFGDGALPRWSSPRRADRPTWGPRIARVSERLGKPFMPWQRIVSDIAHEVNPDTGCLAYSEVRLLVPRQSGKSTEIFAKSIWRMIDAAGLGGRQTLLYVAQSRNKAREKFVDDYLTEVRAARALRGKWRERLSNGSEQIHWRNGSRWGIDAVTKKSGHGSTLDAGDIDEAFSHVDARVEQALRPAMITRPNSQLWVVSTAGDETSLYLNAKMQSGRKMVEEGVDSGVAYFEWSAEPDADPGDPATWWSCMPALGFTVTEDRIRAEYTAMSADGDLAGFRRAYLNIPRTAPPPTPSSHSPSGAVRPTRPRNPSTISRQRSPSTSRPIVAWQRSATRSGDRTALPRARSSRPAPEPTGWSRPSSSWSAGTHEPSSSSTHPARPDR